MVWIALAALFTFQLACFTIIYIRVNKRPAENNRFREGLQMIEGKLNALQDFLEYVDGQVQKMQELISVKSQQLDSQLHNLDQENQKIDNSLLRAKETLDLFQERIPHEEFLDRKNSIKYVKAARMAHQGMSLSEIAKQIDIPMNELELICKLNKESLMITGEDLPDWLETEAPIAPTLPPDTPVKPLPMPEFHNPTRVVTAFSPPLQQVSPELSSLGEKFRQQSAEPLIAAAIATKKERASMGGVLDGTNSKGQSIKVQKVVFPKLEL